MDRLAPDEQEHPLVRLSSEPQGRACETDDVGASATNENSPGALQSFTIGPNGVLSGPVDTINSQGGSPAFATAVAGNQVAVMNVSINSSPLNPT